MGVESQHPSYLEFQEDWFDMQSALIGERCIKSQNTIYLPQTSGMIELERQGLDPRSTIYFGYKQRAQYPEWVKDSTRSMIGLVSRLESTIELKHKKLEILRYQATDDGFSLDELFVRVVGKSVEYGRGGLLSDFDDAGNPYITVYDALSIINWRAGNVGGRRDTTMVVLQETILKMDDEFSQETEVRYRVLDLEDGKYRVRLFNSSGVLTEVIEPRIGSERLKFIPFTFFGSLNNSAKPNPIPLLTMARSAIKYYQLSADYFQILYMTAHPQPYIKGVDTTDRLDAEGNVIGVDSPLKMTGSIAPWFLPLGSDVGYLEVNGKGIELTKDEMDAQRDMAVEAGAKVIDSGKNESGEARKARQDDQHATLHTIVSSASNAIEQAIKYLALWLKLDEDGIEYSVPLEFSQDVDAQVLAQLYNLAMAGKISYQTVWSYMQSGKIPERDYEAELIKLIEEGEQLPLPRVSLN